MKYARLLFASVILLAVATPAAAQSATILGVSPANPDASSMERTLSVSGSGFRTGLTVSITAPSGATVTPAIQRITSGVVEVRIALTTPGTWTVRVTNRGSAASNAWRFLVSPGVVSAPVLKVSPTVGTQMTTFTVSGVNFAPNGEIRRFVQLPGQPWQQISSISASSIGTITTQWPFQPGCDYPTGTALVYAVDASTNRRSNTISEQISKAPACQPQVTPKILSVGGYSPGSGIVKGRWTGQPANAPSHGNYVNHLVCDSYLRNSRWDIEGENFGQLRGSIELSGGPISTTIVSWTNSTVQILVGCDRSLTSTPIAITLRTSRGIASDPRNEKVIGVISTRGYGQCTWFVALTRLNAGAKTGIPSPKAYSTSGALSLVGKQANGYEPAQWDALTYGSYHVAIITSEPVKTTNRDGSVTWSFIVSEMNASWDEATSSSSRTYVVGVPNSEGKRLVVSGIGTNASRKWVATGYYR